MLPYLGRPRSVYPASPFPVPPTVVASMSTRLLLLESTVKQPYYFDLSLNR